MAGDRFGGVIGRVAGEQVRILPSTAYWNALGALQIRKVHATTDGAPATRRLLRAKKCVGSDGGWRGCSARPDQLGLWAPRAASSLFTSADFALTREEAGYLRDRVTAHLSGSLLHFLVAHDVETNLSALVHAWDVTLEDAPDRSGASSILAVASPTGSAARRCSTTSSLPARPGSTRSSIATVLPSPSGAATSPRIASTSPSSIGTSSGFRWHRAIHACHCRQGYSSKSGSAPSSTVAVTRRLTPGSTRSCVTASAS